MTVRILIVDDEPLARERIRSMLAGEADMEVVGECGSGTEAVAALKKTRPDLMFLDVQMPGMDGFEVLRQVRAELLPVTIFVTAYDRHALKAFEVHALDYLLKPFKQTRFQEALERARAALVDRRAGAASKGLLDLLSRTQPQREYVTRIPIRNPERTIFVRTDRIDYAEAAGNYVVLHCGPESHVLRETLTALEEKLSPGKFARISRSVLVNVDQIKEVQPLFKGEHVVVLRDGRQLTLTRGVRELEELLKFS